MNYSIINKSSINFNSFSNNYSSKCSCVKLTDMCWSQQNGWKVSSLVPVKEVISVGGCLNHCAEHPSCDVVQYNPYNIESVCWIQDLEYIDEGSFSQSDDENDAVYLLNRECMAIFEDHQVYHPGEVV